MPELSDTYDFLKAVLQTSYSSLSLETRLVHIVEALSDAFQSDDTRFLRPDQIRKQGWLSRLVREKKNVWIDEESSSGGGNVLPEEESLLRPSYAFIRVGEEVSFQGLLYIGFARPRKFSSQEIDLLTLISKILGEMVQQDQIRRTAERKATELNALQEMGRAIHATLKLGDLLQFVVTTGLNLLKARGGALRLEDKRTRELTIRYTVGDYHLQPVDDKISKRVFFTRTPLSLHHTGSENPPLSVLCVPLLSRGRSFGTLTFYDKEGTAAPFDDGDFQLLLTLANQMSGAIEIGVAHHEASQVAQENEKRIEQFSTLCELNKALLTTVNFDRILHLTLTAITLGNGLGFNRAMLFLVNEKEKVLEGSMAVGPDNAEEAGKIWDALSRKKGVLSDLIRQLQDSPPRSSALNQIVKGIRVPLDQEQCILSRTLLEGKPFNIHSSQAQEGWLQTRCEKGCHLGSEVGCYVGDQLGRDWMAYAFATVPLWGKGKVIGLIIVDNLYNQRPITDEDLHLLSLFANQAGLAIENAMLYRNLEEVHQELREAQTLLIHHEKMVALGELASTVAHEIKNPLVSISGFARRLDRALPDDDPEKRYTQTILKEATRLERTLDDILNYTRDESMVSKLHDLRVILEESLSMVSECLNGRIEIIKQLPVEPLNVIGDFQRLKHAFFNLFTNACQAMTEKGILSIRVRLVSRGGIPLVRVEVEDTGQGIDPGNLHNIFNPFYSTKESGLGLGLPIVHRIITSHGGQIEVDNRPGKGVTFIINLPVAERSTSSLLEREGSGKDESRQV
jgi:signal transduction histidine kinase